MKLRRLGSFVFLFAGHALAASPPVSVTRDCPVVLTHIAVAELPREEPRITRHGVPISPERLLNELPTDVKNLLAGTAGTSQQRVMKLIDLLYSQKSQEGILWQRLQLADLEVIRREGVLTSPRKIERYIALKAVNEPRPTPEDLPTPCVAVLTDIKNLSPDQLNYYNLLDAFYASKAVYDAPQNKGIGKGTVEQIAENAANALQQLLYGEVPGHRVQIVGRDSVSGLKYALFEPKSELMVAASAPMPTIMSLGGTQDYRDIATDLQYAKHQRNSGAFKQIVQRVAERLKYRADKGGIYVPQSVVVTGHSLGGGLAHAFAYELRLFLERNYREFDWARNLQIEVTTWNGLPGREVIESLDRRTSIDELILGTISAKNFVLPEPVHLLGTPVGPVYQLPGVGWRIVTNHLGSALETSILKNQGLEKAAPISSWHQALNSRVAQFARAAARFAEPFVELAADSFRKKLLVDGSENLINSLRLARDKWREKNAALSPALRSHREETQDFTAEIRRIEEGLRKVLRQLNHYAEFAPLSPQELRTRDRIIEILSMHFADADPADSFAPIEIR